MQDAAASALTCPAHPATASGSSGAGRAPIAARGRRGRARPGPGPARRRPPGRPGRSAGRRQQRVRRGRGRAAVEGKAGPTAGGRRHGGSASRGSSQEHAATACGGPAPRHRPRGVPPARRRRGAPAAPGRRRRPRPAGSDGGQPATAAAIGAPASAGHGRPVRGGDGGGELARSQGVRPATQGQDREVRADVERARRRPGGPGAAASPIPTGATATASVAEPRLRRQPAGDLRARRAATCGGRMSWPPGRRSRRRPARHLRARGRTEPRTSRSASGAAAQRGEHSPGPRSATPTTSPWAWPSRTYSERPPSRRARGCLSHWRSSRSRRDHRAPGPAPGRR